MVVEESQVVAVVRVEAARLGGAQVAVGVAGQVEVGRHQAQDQGERGADAACGFPEKNNRNYSTLEMLDI